MRVFIICLLILFGCQKNMQNNDLGVLSKKKFTTVFKEIHLVEAEFEINKRNGVKNAYDILLSNYNDIYQRNQVNEKDFKKALDYYAKNPEKLEQIYIDILGDLKQEKTILDQQETN